MTITVRPERAEDYEAIDEVVAAAFLAEFGTTTEVALIRTMHERGELIPELALVAELDGAVVGHVAFSGVTLDGHAARGLSSANRGDVGAFVSATCGPRAQRAVPVFCSLTPHRRQLVDPRGDPRLLSGVACVGRPCRQSLGAGQHTDRS